MDTVKNFKKFIKTVVETEHPMLLAYAGEFVKCDLDLIPTEIDFDEDEKEIYVAGKNLETGGDMNFTFTYDDFDEKVEEEIFNFQFKNHDYLMLGLEL